MAASGLKLTLGNWPWKRVGFLVNAGGQCTWWGAVTVPGATGVDSLGLTSPRRRNATWRRVGTVRVPRAPQWLWRTVYAAARSALIRASIRGQLTFRLVAAHRDTKSSSASSNARSDLIRCRTSVSLSSPRCRAEAQA